MSRKTRSKYRMKFRLLAAGAACAACAAGGCGGAGAGAGGTSTAPAAAGEGRREPLVEFFAAPRQSGAALWAANCNRCHNAVPPSAFRPDEWDLILNHMRRART